MEIHRHEQAFERVDNYFRQSDNQSGNKMFTLKFMSFYDDSSYSETCVTCPHYAVYYHAGSNYYEISVYKSFTSTEGVVFNVASKDIGKAYWDVCYIENEAGKTINKINCGKL